MLKKCLCVLFLIYILHVDGSKNMRPIIGIPTQPTSSDELFPLRLGQSYIPADYVQWLESAGARVVPIFYDHSVEYLRKMFDSVNGILLPGGDIELPYSLFYNQTKHFYDWMKEANDKGDHFPIWGTCQGFEQLMILASRNYTILTNFDADDISLEIDFTAEAKTTRLYKAFSEVMIDTLENTEATENLHQWGVSPANFYENKPLAEEFEILSTSFDRQHKEFVSIVEAKKYPIFATQFHPERNAFEWDEKEPIAHDANSIMTMQAMANFFVNEARKNSHHFESSDEEEAQLIYNYSPLYTLKYDRYYELTYFFN